MLKIGLTGGIGCGKSTVTKLFNELYNIPVIDADIIARQLVQPEKPTLLILENLFGKAIINNDKSLNRDKLGEIIFTDPDKKQQLEETLHPLIYQEMNNILNEQSCSYCILCIPLLIETKMTSFVDRILVIDCPIETQIKRVQLRDNLSTKRILSIISSQTSRKNRISHADDVIDNTNSLTQLAEQVKKLHNQYLLLSNA
ncbi:MAG: dephospho-CoA kinase [Methylococcales bacterium]|nr:dephospho-CoA kinase [Methylococcales bacterium]